MSCIDGVRPSRRTFWIVVRLRLDIVRAAFWDVDSRAAQDWQTQLPEEKNDFDIRIGLFISWIYVVHSDRYLFTMC